MSASLLNNAKALRAQKFKKIFPAFEPSFYKRPIVIHPTAMYQ
jgi:hypothetical protein